ncbi:MAG: SDR family oxidoreductase [Anaerolineales bacterium]|nr:SDR family oxidoreductase [Anaerolineales bacterium]
MKVLFIGGTGVISSGCAPEALASGFELTLLNRGKSFRAAPQGAEVLVADYHDQAAVERVLAGREFDVVVDWIAFTPDQVARDIAMFQGRVGQFILISSASAYQKPPRSLPITESTPLENPFWAYSRNKIACEQVLMEAYFKDGFPGTIVRPSHTYDKTMVPLRGKITALIRLLEGRPVIVHGDGTSLWVLTHHQDFATGFVGLMGNPHAVGEAFHITSDELLTWNQITELVAAAAGVEANIVHLTSERINRYDPEWGAGLLGDKAHSVIFDNSKLKRFVPNFRAKIPFYQGAQEIVDWYLADRSRLQAEFDPILDQLIDRMIAENQ